MGSHAVKEISAEQVTLPANSGWRKLPIVGVVLAVIGIAGTFGIGDPEGHGAHLWSWVISVLYWASIGVGATFFVLIFFVGRAEWHIAARRPLEAAMGTLPVMLLLLAPVLFLGFDQVYAWAVPGVTDHDAVIAAKAPFLNKGFFTIRYVIYLVVMGGIATYFRTQLSAQDKTGDHAISRRLRALAAPGIALMALAMTFMVFDWSMSTDAHWFSTMFGVIYFAGGFMSAFAVLALCLVALRSKMGGAVSNHHFHGTGKMMYGMMVFWAYVSFSQFMLIWYANIPEETMWYAHRWEDMGWKVWTWVLFIGHFVFPLFALMSRHVKREPRTLAFFAVWLLLMHYVDMFWQIKPNMNHGHGSPVLSLTDILAFVGVGGVFVAVMAHLLTRGPLVPVRDPMLKYSIRYEDV
jgi:hypothetical protein